jgi:hypothetical protein
LPTQLVIAVSALKTRWWHDQDVSLRGALNAQVLVDLAELEVFVIGHLVFPLNDQRTI